MNPRALTTAIGQLLVVTTPAAALTAPWAILGPTYQALLIDTIAVLTFVVGVILATRRRQRTPLPTGLSQLPPGETLVDEEPLPPQLDGPTGRRLNGVQSTALGSCKCHSHRGDQLSLSPPGQQHAQLDVDEVLRTARSAGIDMEALAIQVASDEAARHAEAVAAIAWQHRLNRHDVARLMEAEAPNAEPPSRLPHGDQTT